MANSDSGKSKPRQVKSGTGHAKPVLASKSQHIVKEPATAYKSKRAGETTVQLMFRAAVPVNQLSSLEKMTWVREGISKEALENFKEEASLDYDALARLLSVTRSTLINKKKGEYFTGSLCERIIDLAGIYSFGYEIFQDVQKFNHWITQPNTALGGQAPIDVMDNQFGRSEVRDIIGRIAWGVYS